MRVIIVFSQVGTWSPYFEYISKDQIKLYIPKGSEITLEYADEDPR